MKNIKYLESCFDSWYQIWHHTKDIAKFFSYANIIMFMGAACFRAGRLVL